jgi:hypothetical protein
LPHQIFPLVIMHHPFVNASLVLSLAAATPDYPRDISQWQGLAMPAASDLAALVEVLGFSNYSPHEWRVFMQAGQPQAQLQSELLENPPPRPSFTPEVESVGTVIGRIQASTLVAVDDGWIVGFNQGEFGAALYWFSQNGDRNYYISDDQVIDFWVRPDGIYAIEGLAHLGSSRGSVMSIARPLAGERWQATTELRLPEAPRAVSVRRDGTLLLTLSDSLVALAPDGQLRTVLAQAPWGLLYPNSSLLSEDERTLYIGMRQFVGEFNLATQQLRLLFPSKEFLFEMPE